MNFNMETRYIPGNASDFVVFIRSFGDNAELRGIDGHFRWVIHEDGKEYIARPSEVRPL